MTTNYHTDHAVGAPLTSSELNARLGELDAGITGTRLGTFLWTDYGVVADGVTDDAAALQAMFDAAHAAGGGKCILPRGTIRINSGLQLPYPCDIVGQGKDVTIIKYYGSNGNVFQWKNLADKVTKTGYIHDFTVVNQGGAASVTAFRLDHIDRSTVARISIQTFTGSSSYGVYIDASYGVGVGNPSGSEVVTSSWWNIFEELDCPLIGTGIYFTGTISHGQTNENTVRNCKMIGHSVAGVNVNVGDNVKIYDNDFTSAQGGTGVILNHLFATVRNNRFENCGIAIDVTVGAGTVDRNVIESNLIVGSGTVPSSIGIRVAAGATNTRVRDNRFSGTFTTANIQDNTTGQDTTSVSTHSMFPLFFKQDNIAISQTSVPLVPFNADSGNTRLYLGRPYRIRGITARLNAANTAGTITLKPTIGGTESTTLSCGWTAGVGTNGGTSTTARAFQGIGLDEDTGGGGIGVNITTNAGVLPAGTDDVSVLLWVEFKD